MYLKVNPISYYLNNVTFYILSNPKNKILTWTISISNEIERVSVYIYRPNGLKLLCTLLVLHTYSASIKAEGHDIENIIHIPSLSFLLPYIQQRGSHFTLTKYTSALMFYFQRKLTEGHDIESF